MLVFINPKLNMYSLSHLNYLYSLNPKESINFVRYKRLNECEINHKDAESIINNENRIIEQRKKEGTISLDNFSKKKTYDQLSEMLINSIYYEDGKIECNVDNLLSSEIMDLYNFSLSIEKEYGKLLKFKLNKKKIEKSGLNHGNCVSCYEIIFETRKKLENAFFKRFNISNGYVSNLILPTEHACVKQEPLKKKIKNSSLKLIQQIVLGNNQYIKKKNYKY